MSEDSGSHEHLWLSPAQTTSEDTEARGPLSKLVAVPSLEQVVGASPRRPT